MEGLSLQHKRISERHAP